MKWGTFAVIIIAAFVVMVLAFAAIEIGVGSFCLNLKRC